MGGVVVFFSCLISIDGDQLTTSQLSSTTRPLMLHSLCVHFSLFNRRVLASHLHVAATNHFFRGGSWSSVISWRFSNLTFPTKPAPAIDFISHILLLPNQVFPVLCCLLVCSSFHYRMFLMLPGSHIFLLMFCLH